jgi:SNF2 family DNA or RNA helicase
MKHVNPKHLNDIEAIELIYDPPEQILFEHNFRPYQRWMAEKIVELDGVFLGAEMGLGKTGATLWAIRQLLDAGTVKKVLVIAPLRVAEETWPEEIRTWDFARDLSYRVVTGDLEERKAALRLKAQITIVNRENLRWLLKGIGMKRWNFDMIVYDEGSRLKRGVLMTNPKPNKSGETPDPRMTELGCLTRVSGKTKKAVILSGTPSPNGLIDLFGPIFAIDQGKRLGSSMSAYKQRWFMEDRYTRVVHPLPGAERSIMSRIDDIFFSLKEEDYLDLPPLVVRDHHVRLPKKALAAYREMEQEMALEVMASRGREEIEAVNKGVLTQKLLQIANGSIYTGPIWDEMIDDWLPKESIKLHDEKLDVLESIVEEAAGRPILVAYSFKFDKDAICKRFPYARVFGEKKSDMRDWNDGRIKMLVTHPASAGHGLNFQKASNIAVWYGLTWSLELYRQFVKRLHRSGQKEDRVFLHRLLARGTADEDVVEVLKMRGTTQDQITDAVRVRLKRAA